MSHKFKPLCVDTLPRVFVNILALDDEEIGVMGRLILRSPEMESWFRTTRTRICCIAGHSKKPIENITMRRDMSKFFRAVLNLSKVSRSFFVKDFDRLLNELGCQDFWGTEGQCDPRGDRRDADPYGN